MEALQLILRICHLDLTCPGWDFSWGWSPAALPWILQNCWEYYEYTGDVKYMEEHIYPMLKEAALLYDQILIEDEKTGRLVLGTCLFAGALVLLQQEILTNSP